MNQETDVAGAGSESFDSQESSAPAESSLLGPSHRIPMLRQVVVDGVRVWLPETFGRLSLVELDSPRRNLSIPISLEQAGTIAGLLEGRKPPRPMMGDLFSEALCAFDLSVEVVQLTGKENGIYLGQITIVGAGGKPRIFPCRPSDGIILALGQPLPVPVLVDEALFD